MSAENEGRRVIKGSCPKLDVFAGSKAPWWDITDGLPQHEKWVPGFAPKD
jgi:hypothetical protein